MIHHVVLFQFAPDTTPDQIDAARQALLALEGVIPDVLAISFAPNQAPGEQDYTHCLLVQCDDMDAVARYMEHPAHVKAVKEHVLPIRRNRLAVDFEVSR